MCLTAAVLLGVELAALHAAEVARATLVHLPLAVAALLRDLRGERRVFGPQVDRVVLARVRRVRDGRVAGRFERGLRLLFGRGREKFVGEALELVADRVAWERAAAVAVWYFEPVL